MSSLSQVRQQYEENYKRILEIIQEMGGDDCIKQHRKQKSRLYKKLSDLQRREHHLDELENRLNIHHIPIH